ncbi:DUF5712 family protein [Chryseobacterium polytrichastri]|uniref:Molybdopterin-guanine dinucleotide biosynthesis protein MobB n=1 Tax=Chryseobacterium polytrichastri TaxID=1302687 RepID=A0A1M7K186_9FLAO|nr:DUF5712 family protein [Chryseobacterium polytrichastri]SHM58975.1 hypothetical protein SAMN05444267_10569 [Chryseobacterium polytrichastri]
MYINITDSETGNNKAGCGQLVQYLEKENRIPPENGRESELWFSTGRRDIIPQEARVRIDNNISKLGKDDAKFFLINISPSQKEITYLKQQYGEKGAADKLKEFASSVMDLYARNFKRPGIEGNRDLLWYGKLEYNRYYGHTDIEVKQGLVKEGRRKEGEQMHVQVIVSRKDITNKIKLSPMNNSKGSNVQHSARLGQFDRTAFKGSGESLFDHMFSFNRALKDTMNYALIMKNGNAEQKQQMHLLQTAENSHPDENKKPQFESIRDLSEDYRQGLEQLLDTGSSPAGGLLPDVQGEDYEELAFENQMKKKKRRRL